MDEDTKSLLRWFLIILAGLYILSPVAALAMLVTVAIYMSIWGGCKLYGYLFPSDDLAYHQPTRIELPAWLKPYADIYSAIFPEPSGLDEKSDRELEARLNKVMAETAMDKEILRKEKSKRQLAKLEKALEEEAQN